MKTEREAKEIKALEAELKKYLKKAEANLADAEKNLSACLSHLNELHRTGQLEDLKNTLEESTRWTERVQKYSKQANNIEERLHMMKAGR